MDVNESPAVREALRWVAEAWVVSVSSVVESMTSDQLQAGSLQVADICHMSSAVTGEDELSWWNQELNLAPEPMIWIAASKRAWRDAGALILRAAGISEISDEDARSTWLEALDQSLSMLAQRLSSRFGSEVLTINRTEAPDLPPCETAARISSSLAATAGMFFVGISPQLAGLLCQAEESQPLSDDSNARTRTLSRLNCLLDTEVVVRAIVGRVQMTLGDVLRLTTGSVIELDRLINEPVEVFINDLFAGHGVAVLANGNYGVEIRDLQTTPVVLSFLDSTRRAYAPPPLESDLPS